MNIYKTINELSDSVERTKKIRRRIEDHLRKTADEAVILEIARMLGVKTD